MFRRRGQGQPRLPVISPPDPNATAQLQITTVLDPIAAGALADPFLPTTVLSAPATSPTGASATKVGLSREVAAEIGMYVGGVLVVAAGVLMTWRGWPQWSARQHLALVSAAVLGLLALGGWLRLPAVRSVSAQRRRAISTLMSGAAVVAAVALPSPVGGGLAVLLAVGVNAVARSALSETAVLLGALAVLSGGDATNQRLGLLVIALGAGWFALGVKVLRGRQTAVVCAAMVILLGLIVLAASPWQWPARIVIAVVTGGALVRFARGGGNPWLALGAAAATALGFSLAGAFLGPVVAVAAGGAATMVASWFALRGARRPVAPSE